MATVNIRRDVTDPFYRYKMEKIQAKIEGKGNGIKTVIVNLSSVAQSLARPSPYVLKYFGMELGAQTKENDNDRWIINGAHEASKLQDYLDGFINKFVLCRKCKNPETTIHINDDRILLDCKACGQQSEVERGLKFSAKLLQDHGKKGKKDKSTKKADRKARRGAEHGDTTQNGHGSPHDSHSDHGDENGDVEVGAGSDDEFTRKIQSEAKQIENVEPKEIEWSVDTSEAAVKARAALAGDLQAKMNLDDDEEGDGENAYNVFGTWIIETAKGKGGVANVDDVDIFLKAKELGIEQKHKTVTVLAQTIFDGNMVKQGQVEKRAALLKKMITSDRHEKALLGGTERFVGKEHPDLIPQVSVILIQYYQNDLISEEVAKGWGTKASKKYVDLSTSKKVRKSAEKFLEWLETAESESESEEDEEEDDEEDDE